MIQNLIRAAIAASLLVCAAQAQQPAGVVCQANAGAPVVVRAEGITEATSDLLLVCTGGTPTANGQPIPLVNITLTLNTNLTNRVLGSGYLDALLLIDEPYPASPLTSTSTPTAPANSPAQALCYSTGTTTPGSCNYLLGTGGGGYSSSTSPYLQSGAFTIYAATQVAANQVTWEGVPFDPPGNGGAERIIRLAGIRAGAEQLGLSWNSYNQIVANVQLNTTGFNAFVNNSQQTIAFNQPGLLTAPAFVPLCGCTSHNAPLLSGTGPASFDGNVRLREGFADAFRRRSLGLTVDGPTAPDVYATNVPGAGGYTETGFPPISGHHFLAKLCAKSGRFWNPNPNYLRQCPYRRPHIRTCLHSTNRRQSGGARLSRPFRHLGLSASTRRDRRNRIFGRRIYLSIEYCGSRIHAGRGSNQKWIGGVRNLRSSQFRPGLN